MRLGQYIITEGRRQSIDQDEAYNHIQDKCGDALDLWKQKKVLYRGVRDRGDFFYIQPSKHVRTSAYTNNTYTLIIDNNGLWKKYPKRSKSIVMSTDLEKAQQYDNLFIIFPEDGSNFGVCPGGDIWDGFRDTLGVFLGQFNRELNSLAFYVGVGDIGKVRNFKSVKIILDDMDEELKNLEEHAPDKFENIVDGYDYLITKQWYLDTKGKKSFGEWVLSAFDPKKNDFYQTKNMSDIFSKGVKWKEVWTDGNCIMVSGNGIDLLGI